MKIIWIIGKFTILTLVIFYIMKYLMKLTNYTELFDEKSPGPILIAFILAIVVNEASRCGGGYEMKKKISTKVKVILLVLLAFFLSKKLRTRMYSIISEVKAVVSKSKSE